MTKALIIYHQVKPGTDCPDGIAAAWAVRKHLIENESIDESEIFCMGWSYDSGLPDDDELQNHEMVYIVDFSFPAKDLEHWQALGISVAVIDHHETAMNMLEGLSNRVFKRFDMTECGATLAWKTYFTGTPVPDFLRYVKDRDLWDFILPCSDDVHEAISSMRHGLRQMSGRLEGGKEEVFRLFDGLAKLSEQEIAALGLAIGGPKLEPKRQSVYAACARSEQVDLFGHTIQIVRLKLDGSEDRLTSDICMHLYKNLYPWSEFVACITSDGSYSLRSDKHKPDGGFHVGNFAASLKDQGLASNGGGHRNAAGFKLA